MDVSNRDMKESLVKSFVAAAISVPATLFALDWYAALTISLGSNGIISHMINGGTIVAAVIVFTSTFVSNYIEIEF